MAPYMPLFMALGRRRRVFSPPPRTKRAGRRRAGSLLILHAEICTGSLGSLGQKLPRTIIAALTLRALRARATYGPGFWLCGTPADDCPVCPPTNRRRSHPIIRRYKNQHTLLRREERAPAASESSLRTDRRARTAPTAPAPAAAPPPPFARGEPLLVLLARQVHRELVRRRRLDPT